MGLLSIAIVMVMLGAMLVRMISRRGVERTEKIRRTRRKRMRRKKSIEGGSQQRRNGDRTEEEDRDAKRISGIRKINLHSRIREVGYLPSPAFGVGQR